MHKLFPTADSMTTHCNSTVAQRKDARTELLFLLRSFCRRMMTGRTGWLL
jgi:hypothetical protein